jgi:hypothetical protein
MASQVPIAITLTAEDCRRLVPLVEFALVECDVVADTPGYPYWSTLPSVNVEANRAARAWAEAFLGRLGVSL